MWIDTHAHLNDEQFQEQVDEVVAEAMQAGVKQILVIGIDVASSAVAVELAHTRDGLFAAVGIQPNSLGRVQPDDWSAIVEMARAEKVVAIGESGLDKYWDFAPIDLQREYFFRHLELCLELSLPIVIHCRDAEAEVVEVLTQFHEKTGKPICGVMHSFVGSVQTMKQCLDLGLHISFAGMVTFKKNDALRAVAKEVPLDRLLVETDSPYLSPHPLRGKQNRPSHVIHTGKCLADVLGITVERLAELTSENARKLFKLPPW